MAAGGARAGAPNLNGKQQTPAATLGSDKIPRIVIKQGGQQMTTTERRMAAPLALTAAQETTTGELRKGLWAAVERWLAARSMLPGDGQDRFKSEVKRLCQMLVFDEYKQAQVAEGQCLDAQLGPDGDGGSMRRELTYCKFGFRVPANHPRPPPQMVLEANTYIFSADTVMGKTRKGIKDLRWRIQLDLAGVLSLSFNTQSMEVEEDIETSVLEQLKSTLNTELTLPELGVFLLIAGLCSHSAAAWMQVENVCFWSHNLTLPEFQHAQC